MTYIHPVLRPVANVCYTNNSFIDDIDHHTKYEFVMDAANNVTGHIIGDIQKMNKAYNTLAYKHGSNVDLPDFLSYAMGNSKVIMEHMKNNPYLVIPTVAYKEAYRSMKIHDYKNITCLELGVVTSCFNEVSFEWSVFLVIKNRYMCDLISPETDYSDLNLNQEKSDISYFRPLVPKLTPIYGSLTVPLLLYLFRYYRAVKTTNDSPILFNLPKGLEFLGNVYAKHIHKNEKMTNFLQNMLKILANEEILV